VRNNHPTRRKVLSGAVAVAASAALPVPLATTVYPVNGCSRTPAPENLEDGPVSWWDAAEDRAFDRQWSIIKTVAADLRRE